MFRREAEAQETEEKSGARRHHDGVEQKQNKSQKARADVRWQILLTATGATAESCEPAPCFMAQSNDKTSVPKRARSPSFHQASQPHLLEPDQTPPFISMHHLSVPFSKR
ncbi:hypothetical protein AV530_012578 [Patagioenas fasciata monilis]|uniref:Uncharacterized protein n=1 Tax=Patagioenas fasciata monilis TaxID=372326 RepID=A0A1V4JBI9_PATFA|nr:hypothetical protein AV530_012578 [Patagioenas fasciata monilis]